MQAKRVLFGGIVLGFVIILSFDFPLIFLILNGTCGLVSSRCGKDEDSERSGDSGPKRIVTEVD